MLQATPFRASLLALTIAGLAGPTAAVAQGSIPGALRRVAPDGTAYLVNLPESYDAADLPVPVILFLHGGDRSNTRNHPLRFARAAGLNIEFIVIAPHCAPGCRWEAVDFDALLEQVSEEFRVDGSRVYLTGYSMGGYGSWDLLGRSPGWFAAAAPIAGGGDPRAICAARGVAIRAYHGDRDDVIPHSRSAQMVDALKACDGDAELITYEGVDHGSWPITFRDPDFYSWLLEHRRSGD
ncbi:MAG: dienelactone hydrolase family protein [Gemmatimonadota bacterium]